MNPYEAMLSIGTALAALTGASSGELVTDDDLCQARDALCRLLVDTVMRVTQ